MFRFFFILGFFLGLDRAAVAYAPATHPDDDTIVVRLPNQAVLTLQVRNAAQLRELKKYKLDSLTTELAGYIAQAAAAAQAGTADRVTLEFYPDRDRPGRNLPPQIRITARKQQPDANRVDVDLDRKVVVKPGRDADGQRTFDIKINAPKPARSPADSVRRLHGRDRHVFRLRLDAGLSTLANRQTNATGAAPGLKAFGSGYYNIGFNYEQPVNYQQRSRLALTFGPEFAFSSLRLRGSNVWTDTGPATVAQPAPAGQEIDFAQLLLVNLNVPLMLELKLLDARQHRALTVGAGGFGGYRLYSSAKVNYQFANSDYEHEDVVSGPFHLTNWQYGVQGEVGYRFFRFVGKYHLNGLFEKDKGPQAQLLTVGLKLVGF